VERGNQDEFTEPQSLRVKRKVTDDTKPSNTRCPTTAKQSIAEEMQTQTQTGGGRKEAGDGAAQRGVHKKVTRHLGVAHTNPTKIQYKMDTPPAAHQAQTCTTKMAPKAVVGKRSERGREEGGRGGLEQSPTVTVRYNGDNRAREEGSHDERDGGRRDTQRRQRWG
jgi:hypothetical protein